MPSLIGGKAIGQNGVGVICSGAKQLPNDMTSIQTKN
jgi:hypothetical protein